MLLLSAICNCVLLHAMAAVKAQPLLSRLVPFLGLSLACNMDPYAAQQGAQQIAFEVGPGEVHGDAPTATRW